MKIYINGSLVKTEIIPNNTPTLDETLETFSFALLGNKNPLPLAPMQVVKVDFVGLDNPDDITYFYIISDSVETMSLNPLVYKHNISCIQNTRKLSKYIVRNSVFTQPANPIKTSLNAESGSERGYDSGETIEWNHTYIPSLNWASEKLILTSKEKVKKAYLKISFQYLIDRGHGNDRYYYDDAHSVSDILQRATAVQSLSLPSTIILRFINGNVTENRTLTPADFGVASFDLNATYEFDLIKTLADAGATQFEILFSSLDFLTGTYKDSADIPDPNDVRTVQAYMVQIQIEAETYYWSAYDVLNLLLQRQKQTTSINSSPALFSLPQSGDLYNLLKNTIAPNFAFTENTMYECVAEVFRLFDAIFNMDENGVLGIEYFNDLSQERITPKLTSRKLSLSEDRYTDGLVSYYQDGRIKESFPSHNDFAHLRSAEFGIPEAQDHHFIVPHNIHSIIKCEILLDSYTANSGQWHVSADNGIVVDITRFVLERDIWSILDTGDLVASDWDNRTLKQANTIFFQKGDNKVQVAYTFKSSWNITKYVLYNAVQMALLIMNGTDEPDELDPPSYIKGGWNQIKMRLTYTTSVDGVTKVHSLLKKYNGESLVDQANGAVDLNKLGLNMLGLSLKLGNPTLNATHKISRWTDRVKIGQVYEYEGKTWVANVVNYSFYKNCLKGDISFIQNFNELGLMTRVLREKRMSNISNELISKSEIILSEFVYISSDSDLLNITPDSSYFDKTKLINFTALTFLNSSTAKIDTIKYSVLYKHSTTISGTEDDAIYIPLIRYGAGNTINFEMTFNSPMSAGNKTRAEASGWLGAIDYFTTSVNYTDENGFIDVINIKTPIKSKEFTTDFPLIKVANDLNPSTIPDAASYFNIDSLQVFKQPNEILALNYQVVFLGFHPEDEFVGSNFINNHASVLEEIKGKKCYICFNNKKYSVLDTKAESYLSKEEITSLTVGSNYIDFNFASIGTTLFNSTKSWCLVDENEDILYSCNFELKSASKVTLYLVNKLNRLS